MKVRGDFLGPPRSTDKTTLIIKVSNGAKIRNRYNQVPHLTQDTNGKVTNSQKTPQTKAKRSEVKYVLKRVSFGSKDCIKELILECACFLVQTS